MCAPSLVDMMSKPSQDIYGPSLISILISHHILAQFPSSSYSCPLLRLNRCLHPITLNQRLSSNICPSWSFSTFIFLGNSHSSFKMLFGCHLLHKACLNHSGSGEDSSISCEYLYFFTDSLYCNYLLQSSTQLLAP